MEDTKAIVNAVRTLHEDPALLDEARANPEGTLDRLGLRGIARQAVATSLTLGITSLGVVSAMNWWNE